MNELVRVHDGEGNTVEFTWYESQAGKPLDGEIVDASCITDMCGGKVVDYDLGSIRNFGYIHPDMVFARLLHTHPSSMRATPSPPLVTGSLLPWVE